jgi:hypothetical protein
VQIPTPMVPLTASTSRNTSGGKTLPSASVMSGPSSKRVKTSSRVAASASLNEIVGGEVGAGVSGCFGFPSASVSSSVPSSHEVPASRAVP